MNVSHGLRRGLIWAGGTLLALAVLVVLTALALDAGYLRGPLLKALAAHSDRPIRVDGPLRVHIFSRNPRLVAERVTIGSPPWASQGNTAEVGKITVVFAAPRLGQALIIDRLQIEDATLHLFRDVTGHARDADGPQGEQPLRIEGKGQLNGRPVNFEITGDALRTASRGRRYAFKFSEHSSGSHLVAKGFLHQGFDLRTYDATFEASGADLRDMFYLTGTKLIDTGSYHLSGSLARHGYTSSFTDLTVKSGQSDLHGSVSIDSAKGQLNVDADLNSQFLRLADFGLRAAGRDPEPVSNQLLSRAAPDPAALLRGKAAVQFRALRAEAGRTILSDLAVTLTNDHGELTITPVSAQIMGGRLSAEIKLARRT